MRTGASGRQRTGEDSGEKSETTHRMPLDREAAIRLLDVIVGRVGGDAQNVVEGAVLDCPGHGVGGGTRVAELNCCPALAQMYGSVPPHADDTEKRCCCEDAPIRKRCDENG